MLGIGGVETWFWNLQRSVLNTPPFRLHIVRTNSAQSVQERLRAAGYQVLASDAEIMARCDVLIESHVEPFPMNSTPARPALRALQPTPAAACAPPPAVRPPGRAPLRRLLVIHEAGDTPQYAKYAAIYDAIVAMSLPSANALLAFAGAAQRARAVIIPHGIDVEAFDGTAELQTMVLPGSPALPGSSTLAPLPSAAATTGAPATSRTAALRALWGLPPGKRVLLFLGRVSPEKFPADFVGIIEALPPEWVGLMVGPNTRGIFKNASPRVFVHEGAVGIAPAALAVADAALLPSWDEGGPISLIEAWAARVPFFMHATGLAVSYPEAVFPLHGNGDAQALQLALALPWSASTTATVDAGFRLAINVFSAKKAAAVWHQLLLNLTAGGGAPPAIPATSAPRAPPSSY